MAYFTEREEGLPPRSLEDITLPVASGIVVLVRTRIMDGSFGYSYPEMCWEHPAVIGTNGDLLGQAVTAFLPGIAWPLDAAALTGNLRTLDILEFVFQKIARPIAGGHWTSHESYAGHRHLQFDQAAGRESFRAEVNQLFASHGIAFSLEDNGTVVRLLSPELSEALGSAVFATGDTLLDSMLEAARAKFLNPSPAIRQEALEKLWDAFERTKTLEPGDKKASIESLLAKASPEPKLRERLNLQFNELTFVGNNFMIRHTETTKTPIGELRQVDYLFHWLFATVQLLLRSAGRM